MDMTIQERQLAPPTPLATFPQEERRDLHALWMLRLLLPLQGYKRFFTADGFKDDSVVTALGLADLLKFETFDPQVALRRFEERFAELSAQVDEWPANDPHCSNIERLAICLDLDVAARRLLHFACELAQSDVLAECVRQFGQVRPSRIAPILATVLGQPREAIEHALRPDGSLLGSGLLEISDHYYDLEDHFDLMSGLAAGLNRQEVDILKLFGDNFRIAPSTRLGVQDFPHVRAEVDDLAAYLATALEQREPGCNVLLHGPPGAGKNSLVYALAEKLSAPLFEVSTEYDSGYPIEGRGRLSAYRLAQRILAYRAEPALLLFDEVEDVFQPPASNDRRPRSRPDARGNKAWLTRLLETNRVPAIWLANSTNGIDPALLRRFDYVLELGVPPRAVRKVVLDYYLVGLPVDNATRDAIAAHDRLTPALIERPARVARMVHGAALDPSATEAVSATLRRLVDEQLNVQAAAPLGKAAATLRLPYRLEWLNTDVDLGALAAGLVANRSGRLCLYGPPGTGKTEFARHVAQQLDRPLMVKRASDLKSCWVGDTEKAIANAFREAEAEGAVLLFDEADSFLYSRAGANRSWEVSEVNEMLTQLEAFPGVFLAATNRLDALDDAVLRRFDLKLKFDWLRPAAAWAAFEAVCADHGWSAGDVADRWQAELGRCAKLGLGDFAAILRQARLRPLADAADLIARLGSEVRLKSGGATPIGF